MAATYAQSANSSALDQTDVTSLTIPINPSGTDLYMAVVVGGWDASSTDSVISSVTFGTDAGAGWSELKTEIGPGASIDRASLWGKANPATGNANVVITAAGICSELGACVVVAQGADDTPRTAYSAELTGDFDMSLTVANAVSGDLIIYGGYASGQALTAVAVTPGANQTEVADTQIYSGSTIFCDYQAGADGTAMIGTITGLDTEAYTEWVAVGMAIKAGGLSITATETLSFAEALD